ncbi:uncharacterized protein LAESUDRAFT_722147 [Laetiporus sulphureus 93-53]|uniref:Uncharacterized protein n=1 Tax=Laetiporus sulphureus 93-53 TaxID=1314785 RepID=A0A165G910_9APHY|nr:uncharacterized protein LAESUDRAFT_722147 [Laetiporus sulphureus 93-53]KZT10000.1 hypothetical protein LAESUDRAFT_722147 [Laetiporus sulphureus 93-53]
MSTCCFNDNSVPAYALVCMRRLNLLSASGYAGTVLVAPRTECHSCCCSPALSDTCANSHCMACTKVDSLGLYTDTLRRPCSDHCPWLVLPQPPAAEGPALQNAWYPVEDMYSPLTDCCCLSPLALDDTALTKDDLATIGSPFVIPGAITGSQIDAYASNEIHDCRRANEPCADPTLPR